MEDKAILNFKKEISDFTIKQLEEKRDELREELAKMYLNSDAVIKLAIIENTLEEKRK